MLDMQRFDNLGVIKNKAIYDAELVSLFENEINKMRANNKWDKEKIVKLFFKMIPDFTHKETNKYLDSKM